MVRVEQAPASPNLIPSLCPTALAHKVTWGKKVMPEECVACRLVASALIVKLPPHVYGEEKERQEVG